MWHCRSHINLFTKGDATSEELFSIRQTKLRDWVIVPDCKLQTIHLTKLKVNTFHIITLLKRFHYLFR